MIITSSAGIYRSQYITISSHFTDAFLPLSPRNTSIRRAIRRLCYRRCLIAGMYPSEAKLHILNGMAYEIYFDSSNKIRNLFKLGYYQKIIDYLEQAEFYGSRDFIAAKLSSVSDRPIYIPGQNEAMEFVIQTHSEDMGRCVDDITYHGKSVFYDEEGVEKPKTMDFPKETTSYRLMQEISGKVAAPTDRIKLQYDTELDTDASVIIPKYGFEIKF